MKQSFTEKVALAGMMASGKTTLGRKLAHILGARFVDTDAEMEAASGLSPREFFAQRGEAAFRELERATIARLLDAPGAAVLSLGGGAYLQPEIRDMLRARARTVFLRVGAEELIRRLAGTDIASRPILAAYPDWREGVRDVLAKRGPIYKEADITFDAESGAPAALARELVNILL